MAEDSGAEVQDAGGPMDASLVAPDAASSGLDAAVARPDVAGATPDVGSVPGGVRFAGRVDATNPEAVRFSWQGAGLVARVEGPSPAVKLRTEGYGSAYFQAVIDGAPGKRFEVTSGADRTVTLATGLGAGEHTVELYRETEGMYGVSTFLGFAAGTVRGAPAASGRLIEVIGDSITAGYGNLGVEPHPGWVANPACHWSTENSSWFLTYAAVAGRAVGAEVSSLARSGWGMYRDRTGNTSATLPSLWERTIGSETAGAWSFGPKPQAVVINLGTNDWVGGDPGTAYEDAYVAFLARVRAQYPDAWVFCVIGSMLGEPELGQVKTRLAAVVARRKALGDQRVSTFDFGTQDLGADGSVPTGCDWHPNVADHARMAVILKAQLSEKLGW